MLKKAVLLIFAMAFMMMQHVCFASGSETANASDWYPQYLHDDENYILSDCHMGTVWYVDKDSIETVSETENERILAVAVAGATYADHRPPYNMDDIRHIEYIQYEFLYDLDERKIYVASEKESDAMHYSDIQFNRFVYIDRDDTEWRYIDPHGCWADVGIIKNASLAAYKEQYNHDFY